MKLRSRLYECSIMHHRFSPKKHAFRHGAFMFLLDLDELEQLNRRVRLFGFNRRNLYALWNKDHLTPDDQSLKENILDWINQQGHRTKGDERVKLLTFPRTLGYVFNPVSFYFVCDTELQPVCAVAEVGNTFDEKKRYLVPVDDSGKWDFALLATKHFYVSPFSPLDLKFHFQLQTPDDELRVYVDDYDGQAKTLHSSLTGKARPFSSAQLAWLTMRYPLVTMRVIFLIHWHAFLLWRKGVPFHRKAESPALQKHVFKPISQSK